MWRKKKPEVFQHWYVLLPDFESSTNAYYKAVEADLERRKVPDLEIASILFPEGGFISARREYLRLQRERLVFDLCSAPFGTSWFFSCRFAEIPFRLRIWELLVVLVILFTGYLMYASVFGFIWGGIVCAMTMGAVILLADTMATSGRRSLDHTILRIPVLGSIFELFLRRNLTYYRDDTRLMYGALVNSVAQSQVEVIAEENGVRDVEFIEVDDPMSPIGVLDPYIDKFKETLKNSLEGMIDAGEKVGKKALDKLTS